MTFFLVMKKIIIVGAGPGGLTAGMLLAHRGFDVTIYEKENHVGGRNGCINEKGYKFDIGPTFLMMKFILDEVFEETGKDINKYMKFQKLDPMYRLQFDDVTIEPTNDHKKMREQIKKLFPGNEKGYDRFLKREAKRFKAMYPCLQKDYSSFSCFFDKEFVSALPRLSLGKSMFGELGKYFNDDILKMSFTFQSKYLGMSAWECPAAFLIIPFIEHNFGIYHVEGGLSEISEGMAKAFKEMGGKIVLNSPVKRLMIEDGKAKGIELEGGKKEMSDDVVINADFAYAMTHLAKGSTRKYTDSEFEKRKFSCSTFMLYLGLDKIYDEPHHNIVFAKDYKKNVDDIFKNFKLSDDMSVYVRNASINDPTIAPKGHSAVYVLVPVPNNKAKVDWDKIKKEFRDKVIDQIREKTSMKDIDKHIKYEKVLTPKDWAKRNIYFGATFNLGHNLMQMLYFRPRNRYEEFKNCYLVGGGTHPGSGLPTIYESGRISANLISNKHNVYYKSPNIKVKSV
jgi:phytoene desaturase